MPGAARSISVLVAISDLVTIGLLDANARPIGFHLLGDDQWQAGADASAHLGTMRDDGDGSLGCNCHEHSWVDDGTVRHLARTGLIGGESGAAHDRSGKHETSRDSEALQYAAARNVLDLDRSDGLFKAAHLFWIRNDIHEITLPSMRDGRRFRCAGRRRSGRCFPTSRPVFDRGTVLNFGSATRPPA